MGSELFNWVNKRSAGVLLHPSSLPGSYCIGQFGASAKSFVDLMSSCGMSYWQVLPLGPTGYGNSPYQSYSSQAINPFLLDFDDLIQRGWITANEVSPLTCHKEDEVDFDALLYHHQNIRRKAFEKGLGESSIKRDFDVFRKENESWVSDYALFMALKDVNGGSIWTQWNKQHRDYSLLNKSELDDHVIHAIELICFEQFILLEQWMDLKTYANNKQIEIIGDIPIYVSPDSVDIWANREIFQVTKTGKSTKLAGVPPDYFNADGQFWGNPLYDWKKLKLQNFKWWIDRLSHTIKLYDVVRFDHFRALESYWSIPANASSAKLGKWVQGPGIDFFKEIKKQLPEAKMILEDLGEITQDVIDLKDETGCPGLAVLQFAFGGESTNFYLPHNIDRNSVVYTGTHDNDTSRGWYQQAGEQVQDHFRRYFQVSGEEACWDLIRAAYKSNASICIIPIQDFLSLDSSARMNTPGLATGNWAWRVSTRQLRYLGETSATYLRELSELYGR